MTRRCGSHSCLATRSSPLARCCQASCSSAFGFSTLPFRFGRSSRKPQMLASRLVVLPWVFVCVMLCPLDVGTEVLLAEGLLLSEGGLREMMSHVLSRLSLAVIANQTQRSGSQAFCIGGTSRCAVNHVNPPSPPHKISVFFLYERIPSSFSFLCSNRDASCVESCLLCELYAEHFVFVDEGDESPYQGFSALLN